MYSFLFFSFSLSFLIKIILKKNILKLNLFILYIE